jgi:hypothetical protein
MYNDDDPNEVRQPCCEAWYKVHQDGTDSDHVQALISENEHGEPEAGTGDGEGELPPIRFCPWCGARKDVGQAAA